jgi:signal peptidase complex subunit 3
MMMKKRQALVTFCCNLSFCAFLPLKSTEKNAHKHKLSSARMGHTIWIRANSLFTFASTALALVAVLASITDIWHTAEPDVFLRVKSVERFRPVSPNAHRKKANSNNEVNDEASLNFQLRLDLRPLFSWNTKQIFVSIDADYETERNKRNTISLWDSIVTQKTNALLNYQNVRNKYRFIDQGTHLRGREVNYTVRWEVMPVAGKLYGGKKLVERVKMPDEYVN